MRLLSKKVVDDKKKREEIKWNSNLDGLRRMSASLEEKIRLSTLNLSAEKIREIEQYQQFRRELEEKKQVLLREHAEWQDKIDQMTEIIDNIQHRGDALNEKEYLLEEKGRNLADRERFILASERRMTYVDPHNKA